MARMARLVLLMVALCATLAEAQSRPTFRAQTDLVTLGVTITDRRGHFLADLAQQDFEVFEDGARQTVTYFARGEQADTAPALHVGLVFDTSGSMGQDISLARSAAVKFLNTLRDAVDITLVDFDTEVRLARYGQEDFPRIVERIRSRKPDGFTALYDALGVYLDDAQRDDGRTILVVFTDGGDTRSALRFSELLTSIRASDVTVYTVGFLDNQRRTEALEQRVRLSQIATEAGGEAFFPQSMTHIEEAYDKIVAQIRAQYSLGYVSTNTRRDGRWRKVEVKVRRDAVDGPRVQARKGYFASYQR
jgi:Ca-activated chloride channel family protein